MVKKLVPVPALCKKSLVACNSQPPSRRQKRSSTKRVGSTSSGGSASRSSRRRSARRPCNTSGRDTHQTHVSERYKKVLKQRDWRLERAEKVGMGFALLACPVALTPR